MLSDLRMEQSRTSLCITIDEISADLILSLILIQIPTSHANIIMNEIIEKHVKLRTPEQTVTPFNLIGYNIGI